MTKKSVLILCMILAVVIVVCSTTIYPDTYSPVYQNSTTTCTTRLYRSGRLELYVSAGAVTSGLLTEIYANYMDKVKVLYISGSFKSIDKDIFSDFENLETVELKAYYLKTIGDRAFKGCKKLNSITLPTSVTSIGESAFEGCLALRSFVIPTGVTEIEDGVFNDCTHLESITVTSTVKSIGARAFMNCSSLKQLTPLYNVETIGEKAFYGCYNLPDLTVYDCIRSVGSQNFVACKSMSYNEKDHNYYLGNKDNPYLVYVKTDYTYTTCQIAAETKAIVDNAFAGHNVAYYDGTMEEFKAIKPAYIGGSCTICCSDGDLVLED